MRRVGAIMEILIKFNGNQADRNIVPAYEAFQTLEGISRSIVLVSHFAIVGEVRKRHPFNSLIETNFVRVQPGSFEVILSLISSSASPLLNTTWGNLTLAVAGTFITDLLKYGIGALIGTRRSPNNNLAKKVLEEKEGDVSALIEAMDPAIRKAHTIINNGTININIISGAEKIAELNDRTKEYINTDVEEGITHIKAVSVGMLNVNTRHGRVFDRDLGRTIPISIPKSATPGTLSNLGRSLQRYGQNEIENISSLIFIKYKRILSLDGDVKSYIVLNAAFEMTSIED